MFLIKLLSIIVFDLCANICCIYSMCKNCCKDDAIKETNLRNENFLKLIVFKDDGKVYYNGSSQGFDQIDVEQVEDIVNHVYKGTVLFYGINKELYNSITRKSYIDFKGTQNIGKCKKKSVKNNIKNKMSSSEVKGEGGGNKDKKEDKNKNKKEIISDEENNNQNENEHEINTGEISKNRNEGETTNNIEGENSPQKEKDVNQGNSETDMGETKEDNCSNIGLFDDVFKECEVVNMDKYVLFAVKTKDGNCYLGFCSDGNSKEVVGKKRGTNKEYSGLFSDSEENVEIKMISCGEKLENLTEMFKGNSCLENIVFTPLFVPSSVTNMAGMFVGCSELDELDLFNFKIASTGEKNSSIMDAMFNGCSRLKKLTFPCLDNTNFHPMCLAMFTDCTSLRKCNLMVNNADIIDSFERYKRENTKLEERHYEEDKEENKNEGK